ncbi:MAG: flagellar biosynthesis protein FlhF [Lachnospiraceae bacterium]|nr:flagellar biosynthesis protein FlhF [Lachnospiraceae bacterium]
MIIKKFQGKTELEATALAKKELGENAVIMHVRTVKRKGLARLFKKPYVEVSAALEEDSDTSFAKMKEAVSEIAKTVNKEESSSEPLKQVESYVNKTAEARQIVSKTQNASDSKDAPASVNIEEKLDSLHNLLLEKNLISEEKPDLKEAETDARSTDFFKLIYNTLIDNEVDEKYVNDIIDEAVKIYKPNSQIDYILANIYQRMVLKFGKVSLIEEGTTKPKVMFFIGPTGVGKTTTIAKLASKLKVNERKKIALLTTDTYRIAAAEQLRTYANILEVPFKVIYSPDELMAAIKDFSESDYILIDTAGHSHNNETQKNGTKQFLSCVGDEFDKQIYLVLSATTKYRDLLSVCETYAEFTDYSLIFTKLDETEALGNLYNLKLRTGANMSYITVGQDVPDDIEEFSPQNTVKQLLGGNN